jgi:molybdate transport system substrate-binding protein
MIQRCMETPMPRLLVIWLAILGALPGLACESKKTASSPPTLTVFAAASTTEIITDAAARYEKSTGVHVATSFASSATLAKQIKEGAKADLFLSADEDWMNDLAAAGSIQPDTRTDLLANSLVLIAPKGKALQVTLSKDFDISKAPITRLALADPTYVPAGRYAKEALTSLAWWDALKNKIVPAQDVRAALRLVELGEADAGVVYSTDAKASDKVEVVGQFPKDSHKSIRYPIAACSNAGPEATKFIAFLRTPEVAVVFQARGFTPLPR